MCHRVVISQYFYSLAGDFFFPSSSEFLLLAVGRMGGCPVLLQALPPTTEQWLLGEQKYNACLIYTAVFGPFQNHNCVLLTTNHL